MKDKVLAVIDEIRPMLAADGGDIELINVDEETGIVKVALRGACSGCPHSAITLKHGVEARIRKAVPEVTAVIV